MEILLKRKISRKIGTAFSNFILFDNLSAPFSMFNEHCSCKQWTLEINIAQFKSHERKMCMKKNTDKQTNIFSFSFDQPMCVSVFVNLHVYIYYILGIHKECYSLNYN